MTHYLLGPNTDHARKTHESLARRSAVAGRGLTHLFASFQVPGLRACGMRLERMMARTGSRTGIGAADSQEPRSTRQNPHFQEYGG